MKTVILIIVVAIIAFFALRSLIKTLTGKGGCNCGSGHHSEDGKSCCSGNCSCKAHNHEHQDK